MRLLALGILLILSLDTVVAAQKWTRVTTRNFELYTTAGAGAGKRAIQHFERVRSFFLQLMNKDAGETDPVLVIAFRSAKEFRPFQRRKNSPAFYLKDRDQDVIMMQGIGSDREQTAVHEYVHLLVARSGAKLPLWLNEGMADLYSNLEPQGKKVFVGNLLPGRYLLLQEQQRNWIPLEVLTSADQESSLYNAGSEVGMFYAESWFLTHMLFLSKPYRPGAKKLLTVLLMGGSAEEGFQQAYGKRLDQVSHDLRVYQRATKTGMLFSIKMEKSAEAPVVEQADKLEVLLMEAKILARLRKPEEADRLFAEYRAERPDDWRLEEALGYRYWFNGDNASAQEHFAKAAQLGSENPRMYYEFAMLLGQQGSDSSEFVPLLEEALRLKPDYGEARFRLAQTYLQESEYAPALAHFQKIRSVKPENVVWLFHGMARAYAGTGDRENARRYAERAQAVAHQPSEEAAVEQLLTYLNALDQQEEARRSWEERAASGSPGTIAESTMAPDAAARMRWEDGETPPTIRREPAASESQITPSGGGAELVTVEGSLQSLDCLGSRARLNVFANGKSIKLAIYDPSKVVVSGTGGKPAELNCNQRKLLPVTIEFEAKKDPELGTIGAVRSIAFE